MWSGDSVANSKCFGLLEVVRNQIDESHAHALPYLYLYVQFPLLGIKAKGVGMHDQYPAAPCPSGGKVIILKSDLMTKVGYHLCRW